MARERRKPAPADKRRVPKKKQSILNSERVEWIDYKDVNLLRRFMSERAKIRARRVNGNDQQQQAAVARAIKVAREMALLPYSVRQVTQRSKGKGRDRGDRPERDRDLAAPDITPRGPATSEVSDDTDTELDEVVVAGDTDSDTGVADDVEDLAPVGADAAPNGEDG
jgi:small subunit ribosomal protein S18